MDGENCEIVPSQNDHERETVRGQKCIFSGTHTDVHSSRHDRCAECGHGVGDEWVSYRQDPGNPQTLIKHFGGIVRTGPAEPRPNRPKPTIRDFRYPEDLGVFFDFACAPRITLSETIQEEVSKLLAQALIADYKRTMGRWSSVGQPTLGAGDPPRCHANVASVEGRRVFTMARGEWARFRANEGKLIEIDLERTPLGGVAEAASVIASLVAPYAIQTERIEIWPYNQEDRPSPFNLQDYLVLDNLTRRVNLPMFAARASTRDTPALRKYLREHMFIVKERPDKGRWEAKARALERIVFMAT